MLRGCSDHNKPVGNWRLCTLDLCTHERHTHTPKTANSSAHESAGAVFGTTNQSGFSVQQVHEHGHTTQEDYTPSLLYIYKTHYSWTYVLPCQILFRTYSFNGSLGLPPEGSGLGILPLLQSLLCLVSQHLHLSQSLLIQQRLCVCVFDDAR